MRAIQAVADASEIRILSDSDVGLDRRSWGRACEHVIELLGFGIVALDSRLRIREFNQRAERLMAPLVTGGGVREGAPLPETVDRALRSLWVPGERTTTRSVRIAVPAPLPALYLSCAPEVDIPGISTVAWLREEYVREIDAVDKLSSQYSLSRRDRRLLEQVRAGTSTEEIATKYSWTMATTKTYLHRLFQCVGVHSRAELLVLIEKVRRGGSLGD